MRVTIKAAKQIAEDQDFDQVIILGYNRKNNITSVATFGKSKIDAAQAAEGGNHIKSKILGWPNNLCKAIPSRIRKLLDDNKLLKNKNKDGSQLRLLVEDSIDKLLLERQMLLDKKIKDDTWDKGMGWTHEEERAYTLGRKHEADNNRNLIAKYFKNNS